MSDLVFKTSAEGLGKVENRNTAWNSAKNRSWELKRREAKSAKRKIEKDKDREKEEA